jgi:hypothetical protein
MMNRRKHLILMLTLSVITLHFVEEGHAQDSPQARLVELRKLGKYQEALSLLDELQNNEETPKKFRDTIDFERGVTLIQASKKESDLSVRRKHLRQAEQYLYRFTGEHKRHPLATCGRTQLVILFVERARESVEESKLEGVTSEKSTNLKDEVRKCYEVASEVLASVSSDFEKRLTRFGPLDPMNPSHQWLIDIRERYRADLQTLKDCFLRRICG